MSEDDGRHRCRQCDVAPWLMWLTVAALAMEFLDDIVALVRVVAAAA